jgi:hypothetical protein
VNCISSSVTITTSGMNRCHELFSTNASDGISSGGMPASFSLFASRCTMNRMAK